MKHRGGGAFAIILLVSGLRLSHPAAVADSPYDEATKLYNAGNFKGTAEILDPATKGALSRDPNAHYYLANALVRIGRISEAKDHYLEVIKLVPNSSVAHYCKSALQNLSNIPGQTGISSSNEHGYIGVTLVKNTVKRVVEKSPAYEIGMEPGDRILAINGRTTSGMDASALAALMRGPAGSKVEITFSRHGRQRAVSLSRAAVSESMQQAHAASAALAVPADKNITSLPVSNDPQDVAMVSVHRETSDTKAVRDQVMRVLSLMPKTIKEELNSFGCKIVITPMIVDALPELKQDKPRGYQHGGGYDNVPGLYSSGSKRMVVAERASYKNSPPHLNRSVAGTMFHELGHAYDDARGSPSEHGAFATAYEQDSYKLTNSMRSKHAYYTQPGHAGPSELFAEMFAIVNQENSGQPPRNPHLVQAFPNSYKAMKDLLPTK